MSDDDRNYYNKFATEARKEYETQQIEYRATGSFTPSAEFIKLENVNVWVRADLERRNGLEQEICQYETFTFPRRPAELDERYEIQLEVSKYRRKLKLKGWLNDDGSVKDNIAEADLIIVEQYEEACRRLATLPAFAQPVFLDGSTETNDDDEGGRDRDGEVEWPGAADQENDSNEDCGIDGAKGS